MSTMDQGMENETHNNETVKAADIAATAGKVGKGAPDSGVLSSIMDWIPQVTKGLGEMAPLASSLLPFASKPSDTADKRITTAAVDGLFSAGVNIGDRIGTGIKSLFS